MAFGLACKALRYKFNKQKIKQMSYKNFSEPKSYIIVTFLNVKNKTFNGKIIPLFVKVSIKLLQKLFRNSTETL